MFRTYSVLSCALAGGALAALVSLSLSAARAADGAIPNFAATANTSWVLDRSQPNMVDDLLPAGSGPGPITFDPKHPYVPNGRREPATYRVADLNNPILQPWAREQMRKSNDEVLAGKVPFRARERCWPIGVPGFAIYSLVEPYYFYQTPKVVTIVNQGGPEVRQVFMNIPHSKNPKPSWYGESVGHYENGDTLVIDTIAISTKGFIDNYRTPHSDKLHVVERLQIVEGGKAVEVTMRVEDPGAFTTPWTARQRWSRVEAPLTEIVCNENNGDFFSHGLAPSPEAKAPDF